MATERLRIDQRVAEQQIVHHISEFLDNTVPVLRKQKDLFDSIQQNYLTASLNLRELGMKGKVKLEKVQQAEKEKATARKDYHATTVMTILHLFLIHSLLFL
tara:strand:+ start:617 stop:922 length:306 start_codon:yes stop_codon:yes gene_type:complete